MANFYKYASLMHTIAGGLGGAALGGGTGYLSSKLMDSEGDHRGPAIGGALAGATLGAMTGHYLSAGNKASAKIKKDYQRKDNRIQAQIKASKKHLAELRKSTPNKIKALERNHKVQMKAIREFVDKHRAMLGASRDRIRKAKTATNKKIIKPREKLPQSKLILPKFDKHSFDLGFQRKAHGYGG